MSKPPILQLNYTAKDAEKVPKGVVSNSKNPSDFITPSIQNNTLLKQVVLFFNHGILLLLSKSTRRIP
jgi:hypothetical protein